MIIFKAISKSDMHPRPLIPCEYPSSYYQLRNPFRSMNSKSREYMAHGLCNIDISIAFYLSRHILSMKYERFPCLFSRMQYSARKEKTAADFAIPHLFDCSPEATRSKIRRRIYKLRKRWIDRHRSTVRPIGLPIETVFPSWKHVASPVRKRETAGGAVSRNT